MPFPLRVASTDGIWLLTDSDDEVELPDHELPDHEVAWLESSSEGHWAIVDDTELWHRPESAAWSRVATSELALRCLLPTPGGLLAGSEEAHLFHYAAGELHLVDAFESAPTRDDWFTPWGGPPDVRSMSQGADGTVYVNVHVGGILRSPDGAADWEPTLDLEEDVHEVLAVPDRPGWLLAPAAVGLAVSTDYGETWAVDTDGLHATYCRAVALSGDTVLVSASTGPSGRRSALYRRPLDGSGLQRCTAGLPDWFDGNIDTGCLAAAGRRAAFGTRDGDVYVSEAAGATWDLVHEGLPRVSRLLI